MNIRKSFLVSLLCSAWALALSPASAAEWKGHWTMAPADKAGQVRFGLSHRMNGGNSQHEGDWPLAVLNGLDTANRAKRDVQFHIVRDAGRFDCKGYLEEGEGAGTFRFTLSDQFASDMAAAGFPGIRDEVQFAMAIHDVTVGYARAIKAEKLANMDTDKLLAFRIFDVTPEFIRELRAEGLPANDADKLVAFRVHGVSAGMVRELRSSGIDADENMLIAFRVHDVTPDFVANVDKLGFKRPDPDQLVAMRVHGVTPEFISNMQSRGLKNLTIDQLINLRVHGIN
jgi:hypothetical protein